MSRKRCVPRGPAVDRVAVRDTQQQQPARFEPVEHQRERGLGVVDVLEHERAVDDVVAPGRDRSLDGQITQNRLVEVSDLLNTPLQRISIEVDTGQPIIDAIQIDWPFEPHPASSISSGPPRLLMTEEHSATSSLQLSTVFKSVRLLI